MSNIVIDIAAEFTGKKAFKSADTATQKLSKSAKKLGAALGIAFSTRAIVQYVKQASIAAAQDQKAQKLLAINLKNLGLAYANTDSESFISSLEKQTTILDDELRPAYAQLARTTGSISMTQKLMTVAFDTSNGAGLSYAQTIDILSQAYVGNKKGLKQLNLGLTTAQLAAMSFDEILTVITNRFNGAGKEALEGYAGDMAKLNVATANAAETLGGAFLDKFKAISGGGDIDRATDKIDTFSQVLAGLIKVVFDFKATSNLLSKVKFGGFLGLVPKARFPNQSPAQSPGDRAAIDKANKAAALRLATDKKAAAALAALKAEAARKAKNAEALTKASAAFDLQRINIAAALKATYDKDTKLRLLAMQAIENDNGDLALEYLEKLGILQKAVQTDKLAGITTIGNAALSSLNAQLLAELAAINKTKMSEDDKNQAKNNAFAKYNDALTKQGGLAAANTYAELTQVQLVSVAKAAALQGYGAGLATLNRVMTSNEAAIGLTQSANDLARYTALQDYIKLLGVAYNAATALATANAGGNRYPDHVPFKYDPPQAGVGIGSGMSAIPEIPMIPGVTYNPTQNLDRNNGNVYVTINAGAIANQEEFVALVQDAVQVSNRRGNNLDVAGMIAI